MSTKPENTYTPRPMPKNSRELDLRDWSRQRFFDADSPGGMWELFPYDDFQAFVDAAELKVKAAGGEIDWSVFYLTRFIERSMSEGQSAAQITELFSELLDAYTKPFPGQPRDKQLWPEKP
jgi:hypothetical protein